ncbi:MAG TPA: hypothetical protein VE090_02345 [Methylomirabilota bacterium]|nr:hypothetical protein [Methylomirabilota bacterium]
MNAEYTQNLRFKLQKRVRRLNSLDDTRFHFVLKQFWGFLHEHPVFVGVLKDLELRYPTLSEQIGKMLTDNRPLQFNTEEEQAAAGYVLFGICNGSSEEVWKFP